MSAKRLVICLLVIGFIFSIGTAFSAVPIIDISAAGLNTGTLTNGLVNNGSLGGTFVRDWGTDPVVADVSAGSISFRAITFNNNTRMKLVNTSGNKIDAAVAAPGIIGNATNYPASNPCYTVVYWAYKSVNNDSASSICALGPRHNCTFQYGGSWQIEQWTSFGSTGLWGNNDWDTVAPPGLWHQVVVTNQERAQKMFYDGVLKYSKTHVDGNYLDTFGYGTGNPITAAASYWDDYSYNGPNPPFRGSIAGLRIYDVAFTEAEAIALYTTYRPGGIAYTITASAAAGGTISPSGNVNVYSGTSQTFTVSANTGYAISSVIVDGVSQGALASYTFTNINANHSISATFVTVPTYTITASAGTFGSISPSGGVSVSQGGTCTFTASPYPGYVVNALTVDGVSQGAISAYTFTNITANHTISVSFKIDPSPGRLAYYMFDETTGTTAADSWGTRNGTLNGGCTWTTGKTNNAINLDGSTGYISLPNSLTTNLNDFTIATWVRLDTNSGWNRIFDFGTGTSTNMFLTPSAGGGAIRFAIKYNNGAEQQLNGSSALPTGSWQHVAVTLSGNTGVLYVNGAAVATNTNIALKPSSLGALTQTWIGKSQFNDPYFDGLIDDFRVYSRALSASEVTLLYNPSLTYYTITASAGAGGSITPSGNVVVISGSNQTFTITPTSVNVIDQLVVDGVPVVPATTSYTFRNVTANGHTIAATFEDPSVTVSNLAGLKSYANTGQLVKLTGTVSVAAIGAGVYFVAEDSYKGCVKVIGSDSVQPGDRVKDLAGTITKETYGRFTQYTMTLLTPVTQLTAGSVIRPISVSNKACLSNSYPLANLVKVWGMVSESGMDYAVTDGSRVPLKIKNSGNVVPTGFATLTGVLWREPNGTVSLMGAGEPAGYVFSSFTGDGEDGLHLLTSMDGKTWQVVKNYASMFQQSVGLMRDPCICRGGDGQYHLVWTTGWWDDTIGIAHSSDLIHWTPSKKLYVWADYTTVGKEESDGNNWPDDLSIPCTRNAKVRNCWAPDMFYDPTTKEYVIFWATTIDDPTVFPQTWDANRWERMNQRIYYITTRDFTTYTPRKFFYAPADRVVIDACMTQYAPGDYRMIIKDELAQALYTVRSTKALTSWASLPNGFWSTMSASAFTGPGVSPDNTNAEGPTVVPAGSGWNIYCDYWTAAKNGLFYTTDFTTMTRMNDQLVTPQWIRHGTVFKAPRSTINALRAL